MRTDRSRKVTDVYMDDEELIIHTPTHDEAGPQNVIRIDRYGIVYFRCEYKEVTVVSIDPGPGGIQIFVDGKHEDGLP